MKIETLYNIGDKVWVVCKKDGQWASCPVCKRKGQFKINGCVVTCKYCEDGVVWVEKDSFKAERGVVKYVTVYASADDGVRTYYDVSLKDETVGGVPEKRIGLTKAEALEKDKAK